MRDFSWNYFSMTGDVDAYLLYKQIKDRDPDDADGDDEQAEDGNELGL